MEKKTTAAEKIQNYGFHVGALFIAAMVAFIVALIFTLNHYDTENSFIKMYSASKLSENWKITETDNGDGSYTIRYDTTLPSYISGFDTLGFESTDEKVNVLIDGISIYKYGYKQNFPKPINLGNNFNIVSVPSWAMGRELTVETTYNSKKGSLSWRQDRNFYFDSRGDIVLQILFNDLLSGIVCFAMFFVAVAQFVKSFVILFKKQQVRTDFYLAAFILAATIWLYTSTNLPQFVYNTAFVKYLLNYTSFLFLPGTYLMYAREKMKKHRKAYSVAAFITWSYAFISILLYLFLNIGFEKHLYVAHILMGSVIPLTLIICALNHRNKELSNLLIGTVSFAFFASLSLISYYRGHVDGILSADHYISLFFSGMVIFIAFLVYDNYMEAGKEREKATLAEFYRKSAYTDMLTSLGSRTAFTEDFEKAETEIESYKSICVAVLDLNNLKESNDMKGHAFGDNLIKSLADCLTSTFGYIGKVYRIGGDEFVVLLTDLDKPAIEKKMSDFENAIKLNGNPDFSIDEVAIGWAYRDKTENDYMSVNDLFKLADRRMYTDKGYKKSKRFTD